MDKATHTLEGLLKGIAADQRITLEEVDGVRAWIKEHDEFRDHDPFREVICTLNHAIADEALNEEEVDDLLWLCGRFRSGGTFYSVVTSDLQRLHGFVGGVAVDGVISKEELLGLRAWMDEREHLKGYWPFDEIGTLISHVLQDGVIDDREHRLLNAYFAEFLDNDDHRAADIPFNEVNLPISGLCGVCPQISFPGKAFCFTGKSERCARSELARQIEQRGGTFSKNINKDVAYLVIGADGNEAWSFACYGRKVEQAIRLRKEGHPIILVHEFDFWDAVEDA
jgi:NAD-dependent DNA ligase